MGRLDYETETLIAHSLRGGGFDASEDGTGRGIPLIAQTLTADMYRSGGATAGTNPGVRNVFPVMTLAIRGRGGDQNLEVREDGIANAIAVMTPRMGVRRLTPRECERLQDFPDDYTLIRVGKKWAADGPRYKALGNSMAVSVMRWIGKRIAMVDAL